MEDIQLVEDFDFLEKIMIKNCLDNEQFLSITIPFLSPKQFGNKYNRNIAKLLMTYYQKYGRKPSKTELHAYLSSDKLKESYENVKKQTKDIEDIEDKKSLYDFAEKFLKIRSFQDKLLSIADDWDSIKESKDVTKFYEEIEQIVGYNVNHTTGHDYFGDIQKHVDELKNKINYISTGFEWLDDALNGGYLQEGRALYLFAAETNVGKSIFLHNTAINMMKQNKKVLLYTLEMSEQMYNIRISSTLTKLNIGTLNSTADQILGKVQEFKSHYPGAGLIVKEFPPNTISPAMLKTTTKQIWKAKSFKPDAIVIDYLNLLTASGDSLYEKVKIISEQVRALSYEFECPIISATQLNRGSKDKSDKSPDNSRLSESYGTGTTADCIFGLFRTDQDKEDDTIHLSIMKSRQGKNTGTTRFGMDYRTLTVYEDDTLNSTDEMESIETTAIEFGERT